MRVVRAVIQNQTKPTFLPTCPPPVFALAMRCLQHKPEKRPTAEEVVRLLQPQVLPCPSQE